MMLKLSVTCCFLMLLPNLGKAKIVFLSYRGGGNNIYVMDDDGSNVQRLTFTQFPRRGEIGPAWSPDGKHIAFLRDMSEDQKIQRTNLFIMNQEGSNVQRFTNHPALDGLATWGPDKHHIAFSSNRSGDNEIHVIDILNREIQQLTHNPDLREWAVGPSWSPDGKYIAYRQALRPHGLTTIYVMTADGKTRQPLVPGDKWYRFSPRWSPDSKSVLYCEALYVPGQAFKLVSNNVVIQRHSDGTRQLLRIPKKWLVHSASWVDSGKQVLIAAEEYTEPDRQIDIYRYDLSNSNITNLTNHPEDDYAPDWISDTVLSDTSLGNKGAVRNAK